MSAQEKKLSTDSVVERLRRYQVSQGLPWHKVAEKLGVTRGMVMMVLRGDRNLSAKALFRLEQAEREVAGRRSAKERIVESLIGDQDIVRQMLGKKPKTKKAVELSVDYESVKPSKSFPPTIALVRPADEDCRKLKALFAETMDTRVIALACLPNQFRSDGFLTQLTAESRTRVTTAALGLVIPEWRTLVTGGM
ncbi:MAG TPA: hypothetical protein VJA21_15600 [Verrucomicrobiae bacterium]